MLTRNFANRLRMCVHRCEPGREISRILRESVSQTFANMLRIGANRVEDFRESVANLRESSRELSRICREFVANLSRICANMLQTMQCTLSAPVDTFNMYFPIIPHKSTYRTNRHFDISNSSSCQKSSARDHILNMETVLGQIRIFFIIREMMIRNKPRILRRIVEFFFFFFVISASISLIKNTRRGIPNYWALSCLRTHLDDGTFSIIRASKTFRRRHSDIRRTRTRTRYARTGLLRASWRYLVKVFFFFFFF
jgi:hypothetical protein